MSEVRLIVREAERDWSGNVHGSTAERAIAALSAGPVTLEELETALGRFEKPTPGRKLLGNLSRGLRDEPYDSGIVIIDLAARLVVADWTYACASSEGEVLYHNGDCCTSTQVQYRLAEDWRISEDYHCWESIAKSRREEYAKRPPLDARAVLFGKPLLEFIAGEVFLAYEKAIAQENASSSEEERDETVSETIKNIHIAWLMTPRDDLRGATPRETMLKQRHFIDLDLQYRAFQWSRLEECPPGLARDSFAFRYGGFGTHEIVKYYDLVRELLWSCWDRRNDRRAQAITLGDFLTDEIPRLELAHEKWLDAPDPECHNRTPRSIIDRERARLPEGLGGHEAIVDPDCPCCQMMADMPGPVFWHLDGCEMDDDFAFDIRYLTREAWEAERREWDERHQRLNAEFEEQKRLQLKDPAVSDAEGESPWRASFALQREGEVEYLPLGVRIFGIGCHLAEVIVDLRGETLSSTKPESRRWIDRLNRDFGNLRDQLQSRDIPLAASLFEPLIERFADSLATLATERPEFDLQCDSLIRDLEYFLSPNSNDEYWDNSAFDSPF